MQHQNVQDVAKTMLKEMYSSKSLYQKRKKDQNEWNKYPPKLQ